MTDTIQPGQAVWINVSMDCVWGVGQRITAPYWAGLSSISIVSCPFTPISQDFSWYLYDDESVGFMCFDSDYHMIQTPRAGQMYAWGRFKNGETYTWNFETGVLEGIFAEEEEWFSLISANAWAPDRGLTDDQGRIIVYGGDIVNAQVLWRNLGAESHAPRMRLDLKHTLTPNEGSWVQCDTVTPGAQGACSLTSIPIPDDWGAGGLIDLRLMVDGIEGTVWEQNDTLVIGEEVPVNITGVSTYVVEGQ
jgi:hypothetical protein